jgi:branched-chain amino acid transport system substrate-binding protein
MVQAKVSIVQSGTDFGDSASIPVLTAAKIVYVPTLPFQAGHFATPGVFTFFGGAPAETSAEVQTVLAQGGKNVGMLVLNVPAAVTAAKTLIQKPLAAKGVRVNIVTFDANTADFTPSFTALTQQNPDQIIVFTSGPQCGQIMQAAGALGVHVPVQYPSDCLNKDYLAAGGSGANGALFMMETLQPSLHPDDPGVKLYLDAMKRFAGKSAGQLTNSHQTAFITTYDIAHLLSTIHGTITGAAVEEAFKSAKNVPSLMTEPFSCDGSVLPGFTSICNAGVRVVQRNAGGLAEPTDQWLTPTAG